MREWSAEVTVDEALARRLIGEQFPELASSSLRLLGEGWDTTVWLVDREWVFRFPRREVVLPGLANEIAVLPRLAPLLPLPIPVPTLLGEPSRAFQWPFYGSRFLPGREPADMALSDEARVAMARPLAEFLQTLHSVQLDVELPVDPVRRADMTVRVPKTAERLEEHVWACGSHRPRSTSCSPLRVTFRRRTTRRSPTATCTSVMSWSRPRRPGRGHRLDRSEPQRPLRRPGSLLVCAAAEGAHGVPRRVRTGDGGAASACTDPCVLPLREPGGVGPSRGLRERQAGGDRRPGARSDHAVGMTQALRSAV